MYVRKSLPIIKNSVEESASGQECFKVDHEHDEVLAVRDGLLRLGRVQNFEKPVNQVS